jgi:hypothetical protein
MGENGVASNEARIIYGSRIRGADLFVDHEVFCGKSRQNLPDK